MSYKHLRFPEGSLFLVTGGAGFIGSNLCEAILNLGYRVRCLDDLSTGKQTNVDMFLDNPDYEFIKGDIKDLDTCLKACEGVDYVLNQAAWGSVPRSIEMPLFYCANNIQGTLNMLEEIGAIHRRNVYQFSDMGNDENGVLVVLENGEEIHLNDEEWSAVIQKGMEACDYLKGRKIISVEQGNVVLA